MSPNMTTGPGPEETSVNASAEAGVANGGIISEPTATVGDDATEPEATAEVAEQSERV